VPSGDADPAPVPRPPAKPYDDETRLDMTALIDVTLVLLIFFILTRGKGWHRPPE
jgi:hypothetical protein